MWSEKYSNFNMFPTNFEYSLSTKSTQEIRYSKIVAPYVLYTRLYTSIIVIICSLTSLTTNNEVFPLVAAVVIVIVIIVFGGSGSSGDRDGLLSRGNLSRLRQ